MTDPPRSVPAQADALFRAVFEATLDPIVVIGRTGLIRSVNKATERVLGYAAAELLGRNVSLLMPQPYADAHDAYLANYLRTGEKRVIGSGRDVFGRRKDGSV